MRRSYCTLVWIGLVGGIGSQAAADRCIGPKDNSSTAANAGCPSTDPTCGQGVPPISSADITWCDDFDSYCDANATAVPPGTWPGYPPTPDNTCAGSALADQPFFLQPYHWPALAGLTRSTAQPIPRDVPGWNGLPVEWIGWDDLGGWTTTPYTFAYKGTNVFRTTAFPPVAQVDLFLPGGTIEIGDVFAITIGGTTVSYSAADTTIKSVCEGLQSALAASADPGFAAITWTEDDLRIIGTAKVANVPFVAVAVTTEAGGGTKDSQKFTQTSSAFKQVDLFIPGYQYGGAIEIGDVFTVTMFGSNTSSSVSYAATATTIKSVCEGLKALLAASPDPLFAAVTWTEDDARITGTAKVAGVPFYASASTTDPGGAPADSQVFVCTHEFEIGPSYTNQYHTFSLEAAAAKKFPGMNGLNGTDEHPLILRFWINPSEGPLQSAANFVWVAKATAPTQLEQKFYIPPEHAPNLPLYVELRMEDDQANTDYLVSGDLTQTTPTGTTCAQEGVPDYPVICQQLNKPALCPALSTQVHKSLAFGWLAPVDTFPCDVENGRKPTSYHASVFDGLKWTELRANVAGFPPRGHEFNWDTGQAYFEMKIMTNTIELKLIAYKERIRCSDPNDMLCDEPNIPIKYLNLETSTATGQRQYRGPFNRISIGAAAGYELSVATGAPKYDHKGVWQYPAGRGWYDAYVDRVALLGGVGESVSGACCRQDGSCANLTRTACEAEGGVFRGVGTTCEAGACLGACCQPKAACTRTTVTDCSGYFAGYGADCAGLSTCPCPSPWADWDQDKDVDITDFAALQRCLTSGNAQIQPQCACFDAPPRDGRIDAGDLDKFILCASGEDIPWKATPGCP